MINKFQASLVALTCSLAAGCDSQVATDYKGEPLATITGQVLNAAPDAADVSAALVWVNFSESGDVVYSDESDVSGAFPAQFAINIQTPPDDYLLMGADEPDAVRFGLAYIAALPQNYNAGDGETPAPLWGGIAADHVLAYVESDILPGSDEAAYLGGALAAGFHVLDVVKFDDPACGQEVFDCLRPSADDLDTSIEISITDLATAQAEAPNFY